MDDRHNPGSKQIFFLFFFFFSFYLGGEFSHCHDRKKNPSANCTKAFFEKKKKKPQIRKMLPN